MYAPARPLGKPPTPTSAVRSSLHRGTPISIVLSIESDANLYGGLLDEVPLGVFYPTYEHYPIGQMVTVRLMLPGAIEPRYLGAVVTWLRSESEHNTPGVGLEFLTVEPRDRLLLMAFSRRRAPMLFEYD